MSVREMEPERRSFSEAERVIFLSRSPPLVDEWKFLLVKRKEMGSAFRMVASGSYSSTDSVDSAEGSLGFKA